MTVGNDLSAVINQLIAAERFSEYVLEVTAGYPQTYQNKNDHRSHALVGEVGIDRVKIDALCTLYANEVEDSALELGYDVENPD